MCVPLHAEHEGRGLALKVAALSAYCTWYSASSGGAPRPTARGCSARAPPRSTMRPIAAAASTHRSCRSRPRREAAASSAFIDALTRPVRGLHRRVAHRGRGGRRPCSRHSRKPSIITPSMAVPLTRARRRPCRSPTRRRSRSGPCRRCTSRPRRCRPTTRRACRSATQSNTRGARPRAGVAYRHVREHGVIHGTWTSGATRLICCAAASIFASSDAFTGACHRAVGAPARRSAGPVRRGARARRRSGA